MAKKFPDLSGDGKTTFKDMLIGRGVIKKKPKKKKEGKMPRKKAIVKKKGFNLWERVYKGALKFFSKEYPNKPKRKRAKK